MRPCAYGGDGDSKTDSYEYNPSDQTGFQRDIFKPAFEVLVLGQKALGDGKDLCSDSEKNELKAEQHGRRRVCQCIHSEINVAKRPLRRQKPGHEREPAYHQRQTGKHEEPAR